MPPEIGADEGDVTFVPDDAGNTRVELHLDGECVSRLVLWPLSLRIGAARLRMDGIGGVRTEEAHRNRGCYRRLMSATLRHMASGDAALSMLYGVPRLYPRFGYATAGPDHGLHLAPGDPAPLAPGWTVRDFEAGDRSAIIDLYVRATALSVGVVDADGRKAWERLFRSAESPSPDERCRVICDPGGAVRGYVWLVTNHWAVRHLQRRHLDAFVIVEALAEGPVAAEAVLSTCRSWAAERAVGRERPFDPIIVGTEPAGALVDAAMHENATLARRYVACGESMARVIDVPRLFRAIAPELGRRLREHPSDAGVLRVTTDIGSADLVLDHGEVRVESPAHAPPTWRIDLPQHQLARLCLGAFPPADVIDAPPETARVIAALFPLRAPHMHLPDRY